MRVGRAFAIPGLALLALIGAIALGGCGSSSDTTTESTPASQSTGKADGAMKDDSGAMKDEKSGDAMKEDEAMKGDSGAAMKDDAGAMKDDSGAAMKDEKSGDAMKHDEAMKAEGSGDHMEG